QCVNVVYKGAVVGSPAYAPRISGPLSIPQSTADLQKARTSFLKDGTEGGTFAADSTPLSTSEQADSATPATGTTASITTAVPSSFTTAGPYVDLWDLGRPNSRYWWTVVPVRIITT